MYKDEPMVLGYDIQNEPCASSVAGLRYDGEPSPAFRLKAYDRPTFDKEWAQAVEPFTRRSYSTFPGSVSGFAPAEPHQAVARALNQTYELWIGKHIEAIRVLGCGRTQRGCSRSAPSESEAETLMVRGLSSRDPTHRARSKSLNFWYASPSTRSPETVGHGSPKRTDWQ
jgi:hypothetical protein